MVESARIECQTTIFSRMSNINIIIFKISFSILIFSRFFYPYLVEKRVDIDVWNPPSGSGEILDSEQFKDK